MKVWYLLSPREQRSAILLLIMMIIMALLDTIGVASILPFMAVLTNPELVETNIILNTIYQASSIFGVENKFEFLFVLGVAVFFILVSSLAFKSLTIFSQERFINMREYSMGKRLIEGYIHQPYSWFLNRNSADLGKNILSEVSEVISRGITSLILLIANSLVTVALITLLVVTNPLLALMVGFTLSLSYLIIYAFTRRYLKKIGSERLKHNHLRFTAASEAFGAAKEVKVGGVEKYYIERFSDSAKIYAKTNASAVVIATLPRFALEAVAFGGIIMVVLYLMTLSGNFYNALPIISLYVFAGYRLLPALQGIYRSVILLRFSGPAVETLAKDFRNLKPIGINQDKKSISFNKSITLKNIYYNYPKSKRSALEDICLKIPAKSCIGLVGPTGSGKTTTVDIILGLLEPDKGILEIDGQVITKQNTRAWQRSIGYVPQNIYLSDDTIAANIAFGIDPKDINQQAVEKASKIANLHDFVVGELSKKYQTKVGERGIRLSGGQRQRIGIARALYHTPQVLILDEATSALDNQTEQAVMDALNNLNKNLTIILIAHRLTTVRKCDNIFFLEKGKLTGEGNFEAMRKTNKLFNVMASQNL